MQFFRSINNVEAMTFDLDDTLYNNEPIIRRAEQALQAHIAEHHKHAAKLTSLDWLQLKRAAIAKDARLASDMGQLSRCFKRCTIWHASKSVINSPYRRHCVTCCCRQLLQLFL